MIRQRGVAQTVLLSLMAVMFVGLLLAGRVVQQNQDTRNKAADVECQSSGECEQLYGSGYVCKNFYCVKSGEPALVCREGDVQRCRINGRIGQKVCSGGRWMKCVATSSDVQDKCGMTVAQLKDAAATCRDRGLRWDSERCECVKTALPANYIIPTWMVTPCTKSDDCLSPDQRCVSGYCQQYTRLGRVWVDAETLSPTPTSAVGSNCFGDMVLGKYIDTCPKGYVCIDSTCREPPTDYDDGSWWTREVCIERGCKWDFLKDRCNCQ